MRFIPTLLFLVLFLPELIAQKALNEDVLKAMNNYLRYSNEVVFTLGQLQPQLEAYNLAFNDYIEKNTDLKATDKKVENRLAFDSLYQQIFKDNRFISGEQKAKAIDLIQKTKEVAAKIDRLHHALDNYIRNQDFKNDQYLKKGYDMLRQIEVAFFDLYALKEKLYWNLNALLNSYQDPTNAKGYGDLLGQMQLLTQQSKRVMSSLRANDRTAFIKSDCSRLREIIRETRSNKSNLLKGFETQPQLSLLFDLMIKSGDDILNIATDFIGNPNKYSGRKYSETYYFYNEEMLTVYNRNKEGMTFLYNRALEISGNGRLLADEVPPIFEMIYPFHPAFDSLGPEALPDVEKFMEMLEKKRLDSLKKDSVIIPEIPVMSGFAANNLILLIDISASMNSPEKLPQLKTSMNQFMKLLREEDFITIISYSGKAEIVSEPTSANERELIMGRLNELNCKTSSNIEAGLLLSYSNASKSFIKGGNNRIVLCTDGNFKFTPRLKKLIKKNADNDIRLSIFYFSEKEYSHVSENLKNAAELGKGSYYYISGDNAEEALLNEAQSVRK
jgi:Ca-activated chloride channel homolog